MSDADLRGLQLRLDAAERDRDAWKETAVNGQKDNEVLGQQLVGLRHERNLLKRERAAIWRTVREIGPDGDLSALLDLLAALAQPLRDGEGLLTEYLTDDEVRERYPTAGNES